MRLAATIVGDLRRILAEEVRAGEQAVTRAVRVEADQLKQELRIQVVSAFAGNARGIANAWRSQVFPRGGASLRAAGIVWTKLPNVIDAFERGALIRARGGKFLAIPTGFNAARGRRGRRSKGMRVTPAQMVASSEAFLRPFRNGRGFVWCLPVRGASGTGRRSRRTQLWVNVGQTQIGTRNRKGREAWAQGMLEQGMVPMFLLLPQVKLPKRLDVKDAADRALHRLPGRVVRTWEAIVGHAP